MWADSSLNAPAPRHARRPRNFLWRRRPGDRRSPSIARNSRSRDSVLRHSLGPVSLKIIPVFLRSSATVWLSSTRSARTFDTVRSYHWRALPEGRAEVEPLLIIGTGMGSYSVELLWHTGPAITTAMPTKITDAMTALPSGTSEKTCRRKLLTSCGPTRSRPWSIGFFCT